LSKTSSYRNFSYIALGRFVAAGLQALFYLIFAALLDPEQYGQMSYLIAIASTFSVISRFGFPHTVSVYQAKGDSTTANQVNVLAILSTSVGALTLLFFNPLVAVLSLSISFILMNQYNLLGLKKYKTHALIDIVKSILVLILPLALFFVLDIPGVLLGIAISNFLCCFPFFRKLSLNLQGFDRIRKNYKVLIHNFGADSATSLPRVVDKLVIVPLLGFSTVGIYQFNLQILFALEMLPIIMHGFLLSEESSGKNLRKFNTTLIIISALVVIAVIFLSPIFVSELFPKYSEGIFSLQIMVISLMPLSISAMLSAKLQAKESTKIGFSALVRIGSLIILILFLGNLYGLIGLSMAVLISSILYAVFLSALYYKMKN